MSFESNTEINRFKKITVDSFIQMYKQSNPDENVAELRNNLLHFKKLKKRGEKCICGNPIWAIGSAISGKGCFTCITGESYTTDDYEIK
jgi:hypothetical protein